MRQARRPLRLSCPRIELPRRTFGGSLFAVILVGVLSGCSTTSGMNREKQDINLFLREGQPFSLQCSEGEVEITSVSIRRKDPNNSAIIVTTKLNFGTANEGYKRLVRDRWLIRLSYDGNTNALLKSRDDIEKPWKIRWAKGSLQSPPKRIYFSESDKRNTMRLELNTAYGGNIPLFRLTHSIENLESLFGGSSYDTETFHCMHVSDIKARANP